MVHLSFGYQADLETHGVNADAIFNVFAKTGNYKAACFFPNLTGYAHIKAARMKLPYSFFITPYAASSKWRGHRVTDSFLNRGEGCVCSIRSTTSIKVILSQ